MTFDPNQGRRGYGAKLFALRFRRLGLSQQQFADRFGLSVGMIRDAEQCRVQPSRALRVLVELIADNPDRVAAMAKRAATEVP